VIRRKFAPETSRPQHHYGRPQKKPSQPKGCNRHPILILHRNAVCGKVLVIRTRGTSGYPLYPVKERRQYCPEDGFRDPANRMQGKGLNAVLVFFDLKSEESKSRKRLSRLREEK
jgi:hypothetical protein